MKSDRYVLLDRDGVINEDSDQFIKSPDEWRALPGSLEAIAWLNAAGYKIVVVTNQSGLARGLLDSATLTQIHQKMQSLAQAQGGTIDALYYCPHAPGAGCHCRKPKPGLLEAFAADRGVNLQGLYVIGDSLRDLEAAHAVGARPILVKTGKGQKTLAAHPDLDVPVFDDLWAAAKYITAAG